ncbi:hypothetical protein M501DRAFT_1010460 [Patellaria atrata CBS 101060]|uniref:Spermatogenesis-associated protein 20-like TRX domain-containing protein n=1 Tax=Patellaria atrata CBS 101060 TaxID=1346257 RepID=A0A9P4VSX8_9PEZI|nr:hypothetical protein M501DRAFT_1010460 [Patellaria atrata CBS 101060]
METQAFSTSATSAQDDLKLTNRLSESRSPYVRQHMNNPVAWQMWTPETLALAKKHNRLVFLSVGYSACHWCHVMERESFENQEVANILNNHFVPIKIDREERPDVDRIYMNFVQVTTGSGGWPLNVFLTPDLEPIFGGTYWPGPTSATAHADHIGFVDILQKIQSAWKTQAQKCKEDAKGITETMKAFAADGTISRLGDSDGETQGLEIELLEDAYEHYARKFDTKHAGFGAAPKFPTPVNLSFLLRLAQYPNAVEHVVGEQECKRAKEMVLRTLKAMARGGIHDQIGNGFSRYSVTRDWSLPHFEKMLYDQVQLLPVYLDAYLITKDEEFLDVVHDIATYLTTPPLHSPTGGFFSAEDADSLYRPNDTEKREGAFYVWTLKEFRSILGDINGDICAKYYDVQENGNVSPEHDAHDELLNQNVLHIRSTPETLAKEFGLKEEEVVNILKESRIKLLEHRNKERPRPALDDKIVVAWNGLALGALARTSTVIESIDLEKSKEYKKAAEDAASFIKKELYNSQDGTLKRVYREGPGDAPGFADDYAFLISGLIDLYEAIFDDSYLEWAEKLQKTQNELFWDSESGGFFSTVPSPDLILRLKDGMDDSEPSANGVSAQNLHRLAALFDDATYTDRAQKTALSFEAEIMQHPYLFSSMMGSVVAGRLGVRSVVVCGEGERVEKAVREIRERVVPNGVVARLGAGAKSDGWLRARNELFKHFDANKPRVQVCEDGVCREELEVEEVARAIKEERHDEVVQ